MNQRFSKQRKAIEDNLRARTDHPTAETLYQALRAEQPSISLGTVYRNLTLLEEQGLLQRIPMTGGPDRFDGDISEHHHLQCLACGAIIDLPGEDLVDMAQAGQHAAACGAQIQGVRLLFTGLCANCTDKQ